MKGKDLLVIAGVGIAAILLIPKAKDGEEGLTKFIPLPATGSPLDIGGLLGGLTGLLSTTKGGISSIIIPPFTPKADGSTPEDGGGIIETIQDFIKSLIPDDVGEGLIPDIPDGIEDVVKDIIDEIEGVTPDIPDIWQPIKDISIGLPDVNIDLPELTLSGESLYDFFITNMTIMGHMPFQGWRKRGGTTEVETELPTELDLEEFFTPEQLAYAQEQAKRWEPD